MTRKFLIKVLDCNNEEFYSSHSTFHKGDSGLDLFVVDDMIIPAGETKMIKLGITCQSRKFSWCFWKWLKNKSVYKYYSYLLFPRSSISKTPLVLRNSIGLIDAGYTGEIMAAMYNTSSEPFLVERGERYVQLVNSNLSSVSFELVYDHRETTRGSGGFGSTDANRRPQENTKIATKKFKNVIYKPRLDTIYEKNKIDVCEDHFVIPNENSSIEVIIENENENFKYTDLKSMEEFNN